MALALVEQIFDKAVGAANQMHWSDLNIGQQIQIISGIFLILTTMTVAIVIFRSVWIRKGYEGVDEILEASEVATMLSHVIAFICLIIFEYLVVFNSYMIIKFPDYAYWLSASGFLGPEVYLIFNKIKNKIMPTKEI